MNPPLAPRFAAARRSCLACLAVSALSALATAAPARADGADAIPLRLAQPNSLRASLFVYPPSGEAFVVPFLASLAQPADSYVGLTYARQLGAPIAWELTGGFGGPGGSHNGPHAGSALRLTVLGGQRSGLTLALGGHAAFLHGFGTVGFGTLELAWQLRLPSGFDLVLGGGATTVVAGSRVVHPPPDCGPLECVDERFEAGDTRLSFVFQTGWAF